MYMHVYFVGIGGAGIGPLAVVAKQAGYHVDGSDKQDSEYVQYLTSKGIVVKIGQSTEAIAQIHAKNPIDWVVYSSAIPKENSNHPELLFAKENNIKSSKRDEFIAELLNKTGQKMIAIAGTHGKTTTTAMTVWLFKQLNIPVSYSVGAKLSFGEMGEFNPKAEYFVYEADEYDRNFLSFNPFLSIISGIGYDHPDIYPSKDEYNEAFREFIGKSKKTAIWQSDADLLSLSSSEAVLVVAEDNNLDKISLTGEVNRRNAYIALSALEWVGIANSDTALRAINEFPSISRRFEKIAENIYSDYAHTPEKIKGAIQMAHEVSDNIVVVYEGLHNTRQHFIQKELEDLFEGVDQLYIAPSYLAREDESLEMLTPKKLSKITLQPDNIEPVELDENLKNAITKHANSGDLVLCLSAGGGGSLDEWLRREFE